MAQSDKSPKIVLADYFLGLSTRSVSGRARPWRLYYESEEDADRKPVKCKAAFSGDLFLTDDIKDIASTYYPSIGPYDVTDPHVAEYHVLLAKAAGIDGFMAEYTIGQEPQLLSLVNAAKKYDFKIGVNWITQSHLAENKWEDRAQALDKAKELVRWMAREVYAPCGVRVDGKSLLLIFLAHPREAGAPFDPFFSPQEVQMLKQTALDAGCAARFLVLPWEHLPILPAGTATGPRVWDGYFPWVWMSHGNPPPHDTCWTHSTSRQQYVQRLQNYYTMAQRMQAEGRIGTYIGAVCPGFDDHKGQAWGEAKKRHLPRDGGLTLKETWDQLKASGVNTALIITWNDWVESSQIEPSLELGDTDLLACARQTAKWKQTPLDEQLLAMPLRLLRARRDTGFLCKSGVAADVVQNISKMLDQAAIAIGSSGAVDGSAFLDNAEAQLLTTQRRLQTQPVHIFWEHGFDSFGINHINDSSNRVTIDDFTGIQLSPDKSQAGFVVADDARIILGRGAFVGKLCLEYLDVGSDFLMVKVDAQDEQHQVIASFKKTNTGRWLKASLEIVNARFLRGLPGNVDLLITQRSGTTGGVRMIRLDGVAYSV